MRRQDLEALRTPYPAEEPRQVDDRFADALGLPMGNVRRLSDSILGDLDGTQFGIGWWKAYEPAFGARARILVGDQLYRSAASIETNVVEAKLHLLECLDAWEREEAFLARMVQLGPGNAVVPKHPPRVKAEDDLGHHLISLHTAGFFRAIASAFDCLGACIAGVVAVNGWIVEASFGKTRGALVNLSPNAARDVERKAFRDKLDAAIAAAGPTGWLEWTLGYRHMLVHRARRMEVGLLQVNSWLVDPNERPILHAQPIPQLARDPQRSDVEVWRDRGSAPVLTEAARTTMEEIMKSSLATIDRVALALVDFWAWRKANVSALAQPAGQWPNGAAGEATGFVGYEPTQLRYEPKSMSANPTNVDRMVAASVADSAASNWPDFGGNGDNL